MKKIEFERELKRELERAFETLWKQLGGLELTPEFRFHPKRKWSFDFAIPEKKIAFEIEGGTWVEGRHSREPGYTKDCEKYNEATRLGWRVFRLTSTMLDDPTKYIEPLMTGAGTYRCGFCDEVVVLGDSCDNCIPF